MFLQTSLDVSPTDCVPMWLVMPAISALTAAVVYQTRQISRLMDNTERRLDELLKKLNTNRED